MATIDRRGVSVDSTDTPISGDPNPGLAIKAPALAATTGNITLSGLQVVDGVTLVEGNRVLVWQQADARLNGLYNASSGVWTRTVDMDGNDQLAAGLLIVVASGAMFAQVGFIVVAPDPISLGITPITIVINTVPPTRHINTVLPLQGGGNLAADLTLSIEANGIGYGLLQQVSANRILGNPSGLLTTASEIALGTTLTFVGAVLETAAGTGDVAWPANSFGPTAIQPNAVTNAKMATMVAFTLKGNATSGAAVPTDISIPALAQKASPVGADILLLVDSAAANALKNVTVAELLSAGVASIAGNTGAFTVSGGVTHVANDLRLDPVYLRGYLSGLTLSAAGGTATFGISAGIATDGAQGGMMSLAAAFTKTTSAWAVGTGNGGLDTGAIATSTWYHAYLIKRPDTGVVDVCVSLSASAPTTGGNIPAAYTLSRRIGAMKTDGSSQWTAFVQNGDEFLWVTSVKDVDNATQSTTAVLYALTVPTGVKVNAILTVQVDSQTTNGNVTVYLTSPDQSDEAATAPGTPGPASMGLYAQTASAPAVNEIIVFGELFRRTNTSAQVRARCNITPHRFGIQTYGYVDTRGRYS